MKQDQLKNVCGTPYSIAARIIFRDGDNIKIKTENEVQIETKQVIIDWLQISLICVSEFNKIYVNVATLTLKS